MCPIPIQHLIPDKGRINESGQFTSDEYMNRTCQYNIGELFDICCVSQKTKPLAAMDLISTQSIEFIKKCLYSKYYDSNLFYRVITYLCHINIPSFHWIDTRGNYLKCVYYNPDVKGSRDHALKLILVLHTDYYENHNNNSVIEDMKYHIRIGHLLGYTPERIVGYIIRNIEYNEVINNITNFVKQEIYEINRWFPLNESEILAAYPIKSMRGINISLV